MQARKPESHRASAQTGFDLIFIDLEPHSASRLSIEVLAGEELAVSMLTAAPIGIFLCTDAEFERWLKGRRPKLLAERHETSATSIKFLAPSTHHLSLVVINESELEVEVGIDAAIKSRSKAAVRENPVAAKVAAS